MSTYTHPYETDGQHLAHYLLARYLLVACRACNKEKASEPSWAMYPIQSLVAGFDTQNLSETPRVLRYAVQARTAKQLAGSTCISLREAYIRLGRPGLPLVLDTRIAVDVFNLQFNERRDGSNK